MPAGDGVLASDPPYGCARLATGEWHCFICNCAGAQSHFEGRKHLKNVEKWKETSQVNPALQYHVWPSLEAEIAYYKRVHAEHAAKQEEKLAIKNEPEVEELPPRVDKKSKRHNMNVVSNVVRVKTSKDTDKPIYGLAKVKVTEESSDESSAMAQPMAQPVGISKNWEEWWVHEWQWEEWEESKNSQAASSHWKANVWSHQEWEEWMNSQPASSQAPWRKKITVTRSAAKLSWKAHSIMKAHQNQKPWR